MTGNQDFVYGGPVSAFEIGGAGGTDIGFTRGGVTITHNMTTRDREVDQEDSVLDILTTKTEMMIEGTAAEVSLENMAYIWNIAAAAIVSSSLQVQKSANQEQEIHIEAPGPEGKTTSVDAYRCFAQGDSSVKFGKDVDAELPFHFRVMVDTSKSPSRLADWVHA